MLTEETEYDTWLASLKPGDHVAYWLAVDRRWVISRVERRTPTGRITLVNTTQWRADGRSMSNSRPSRLERVTQKISDTARREHLLRKLRIVDWSKLTLKQLEDVFAIIEPEKQT